MSAPPHLQGTTYMPSVRQDADELETDWTRPHYSTPYRVTLELAEDGSIRWWLQDSEDYDELLETGEAVGRAAVIDGLVAAFCKDLDVVLPHEDEEDADAWSEPGEP